MANREAGRGRGALRVCARRVVGAGAAAYNVWVHVFGGEMCGVPQVWGSGVAVWTRRPRVVTRQWRGGASICRVLRDATRSLRVANPPRFIPTHAFWLNPFTVQQQ